MPRFPFLSEISQITPSYYDLLLSIVPDFISLSSGRIIYRHHVPFQNVIKYFSRITFTVQFLTSPDGMQIIPITRFKSFVKIWSFIYHFIHQILVSSKNFKNGFHLGKRLLFAEFKDESIGIRFHNSSFITKDHGMK